MIYKSSIKGKITTLATSVVLLCTLLITIGLFISLVPTVKEFEGILEGQYQKTEDQLKTASLETRQKITKIFEEQTHKKALNFVHRDALVLTDPFLENSYFTIVDYLTNVFRIDQDLLAATFFAVSPEDIKAWFHMSRDNPQNVPLGTSYDHQRQAWLRPDNKPINDPSIASIIETEKISIRKISYQSREANGNNIIEAYEVSIPIFDNETIDIKKAKQNNHTLGYLRYIISLARLQETILNEKNLEETKLQALQTEITEQKNKSDKLIASSIERTTLWLAGIIGISLLISFFFSFLFSKKLSEPILDLTTSAKKIAHGDYDVPVVAETSDELGMLSNVFEQMRQEVKRYTENLQELVDEKTRELHEAMKKLNIKNRNMKVILDNIHQGIFVIDSDGSVHEEYSKYLTTILETSEVFGKEYSSLILDDCSLNAECQDQIKSVITNSLGIDAVNFESNNHLLPREFNLYRNGRRKAIEVEWNPITQDDSIEGIMVTLRDITELKELQAESAAQQRKMQIIQQLIDIEPINFKRFLSSTRKYLDQCRKILDTSEPLDHKRFHAIYHNLHTIKGNARSLGFEFISLLTHEIERDYISRDLSEVNEQRKELLTNLRELSSQVDEYEEVNCNALKRDHQQQALDNNLQIRSIKYLMIYYQQKSVHLPIYKLEPILSGQKLSLSLISEHMTKVANKTAKSLGKAPPSLEVYTSDILVNEQCFDTLINCMTHLVANSVDHGIEFPEERVNKGKPKAGAIWLVATQNSNDIEITYHDDGRGLNVSKVSTKGLDLGLIDSIHDHSHEELANLIFHDGFSTSDQISDISGRGVGMAVIMRDIRSIDGDIKLLLDPEEEKKDDFFAVRFRLIFPDESANQFANTKLANRVQPT
jgi:PAS domain-containing protein/HPt (histidine-containing phosphotransfer) domain-containing protein